MRVCGCSCFGCCFLGFGVWVVPGLWFRRRCAIHFLGFWVFGLFGCSFGGLLIWVIGYCITTSVVGLVHDSGVAVLCCFPDLLGWCAF